MDGGETHPPVAGRFLKLLIPGFETALKLHPAFSSMLNDTDLNSKTTAVLKSCKGSWEIDVKKCDHGCLHFLGKTWEDYVCEHNLREGDFIVFEHNGHLHFTTNMFDETGREKDFATTQEEEVEESISEDEQMLKTQFQLTLTRRNFTHHYLTVPMSFAKSNDMMRDTAVKLQDGNGDTWQVRLIASYIERTYRPCEQRVHLSSVTEFMRDNDLKVGDTCMFKLVQLPSTRQEHIVMDVAFVRGREKDFAASDEEDEESTSEDDVECVEEKDEEDNDEDDVPIEGNYASSNQNYANSSRFQITIPKWISRNSCVNVPKVFAISNDMLQSTTVKLQNGAGDSWVAKLQVRDVMDAGRPRKRIMLTGLGKFVKENKLEIGDKCTFELAQPSRSNGDQHLVMDVVFERRRQYSNCDKDFATSEEEESSGEDEVECFEHVEQTSKSQFQRTLSRWNFAHHSMYVPKSFATSNDMMRDTTVKLQDGKGDSWQVRLVVSNLERANGACKPRVYLSTLAEFMRDNGLKVGDMCIFKLVQLPSTRQEHVVMDVAFVRGRQQ